MKKARNFIVRDVIVPDVSFVHMDSTESVAKHDSKDYHGHIPDNMNTA